MIVTPVRDATRNLNAGYARIPRPPISATLVCYSFDQRTRLGPFLFASRHAADEPRGARAVAAALHQAGFKKTRIVLRQWNPNFKVNEARLDGAVPEMLLVSSMQIHSASAYEMITDAYKSRLESHGPSSLASACAGRFPRTVGLFRFRRRWRQFDSADVVVTGEEFIILELLDRLMEYRVHGEHLRKTFHRLRRSGLLDDIPGLVFCEGDEKAPLVRLINTGIQRMVQDLDELPHPLTSLELLEPPHARRSLSRRPLPVDKIHRHAGMISLVTTHGCKFHCNYCPIPAYNQFTFRYKDPERLRDEITVLTEQTAIHAFFGTDDNFFNNRETVEEVFTALAKGTVHGKPFRDSIFFGTEATEFDVYKNQDLLPLHREGVSCGAIWFGMSRTRRAKWSRRARVRRRPKRSSSSSTRWASARCR